MRDNMEKVVGILFRKQVDIGDIVESEDYDDFVKMTEKFYDNEIKKLNTISKDKWLKQWLLTYEEYQLLKNYHKDYYGD